MGVRVFGTKAQEKKTTALVVRLFSILGLFRASVDIYYVSNVRMRALYKHSGGKDKVTNVLSFPHPKGFVDPEAGDGYLGEIYLAPSHILKEAKEMGISQEEWNTKLLVHGVLHLLGFDHENDREAKKMECEEDRIYSTLQQLSQS